MEIGKGFSLYIGCAAWQVWDFSGYWKAIILCKQSIINILRELFFFFLSKRGKSSKLNSIPYAGFHKISSDSFPLASMFVLNDAEEVCDCSIPVLRLKGWHTIFIKRAKQSVPSCYFIVWPFSKCAVQQLHPFLYNSFAHSSVVICRSPPFFLSKHAWWFFLLIAWSIVVLPVHWLVKCPRGPDYKLWWECFTVKSVPCSHKHLFAFSLGLRLGGIRDLQQIFIAHWLQTSPKWRVKRTQGKMREMV